MFIDPKENAEDPVYENFTFQIDVPDLKLDMPENKIAGHTVLQGYVVIENFELQDLFHVYTGQGNFDIEKRETEIERQFEWSTTNITNVIFNKAAPLIGKKIEEKYNK